MGPRMHLEKLKRGHPGINRLDRIAKAHDIDYSKAKTLKDKWKADDKVNRAIANLPEQKNKRRKYREKDHSSQMQIKIVK